VAHACNHSYKGGYTQEDCALSKYARPYLNNLSKAKRARGMPQVAECLPSKSEALNSNPSAAHQNQNQNNDKKSHAISWVYWHACDPSYPGG
jgi:hypothetical protein